MKKVFSIIITLLVFASMFSMIGCGDDNEPSETTTVTEAIISDETTAEQTTVSETIKETESTVSATEETTTLPAEMTVGQIVELFNSSANKIKTKATKVVKNYEKRNLDEEELEMPRVLESTAETMVPVFMKDDTDPIVYASRDEITENYLVPKESYVSKMKESDVKKATCEETETEYLIYIKLKSENNPVPGKGVGSVCDVIEASEVAEKASFIESFTTEYYDCEIKARIDKKTGNVVWANYTTPLVLNIRVNMFGTHDLSAGLTFEKDYTITY